MPIDIERDSISYKIQLPKVTAINCEYNALTGVLFGNHTIHADIICGISTSAVQWTYGRKYDGGTSFHSIIHLNDEDRYLLAT